MRGSRGVLHNLSVLTIGTFAAQLLNLAALVYLARLLGDHWFGVVQVGVAVSAYALITAEWGLMSLGIREIARLDNPAEVRDYVRLHQGLLAVLAFAVLAVGLAILPLFPFYRQDPALFLLYLSLVIPQIFMGEWVGIGVERMSWVGAAKTAASLSYAVLVLVFLRHLDGLAGWPTWRWIPALYLFSFVAGNLVVAMPVARWLGGPFLPRFGHLAEWRRRLTETAPIGASIVTMRVLMNGDLVLLGILSEPEIAGQYAAAAKIGFVLIVAMEVLWKALLPRLSRLARGNETEFLGRFRLYLGLVTAVLVPISVGGVLLGPDLMALIYDDSYAAGRPIFQVLVVSYSLLSLGWFLGNSLIAADRQREFFPPLVVSAAVAVAGCFILVPRLAGLGAAYGMLAGHGTLLMTLAWICRRWLSGNLWRILPLVAGGGLAMALVAGWTGSLPVVVRIVVAGLVYLAVTAWPLRRWAGFAVR